jgi:hypothetical protein
MHALVAAQDSVGGAGVDAQGATDAPVLINENSLARAFKAKGGVQSLLCPAGDVGQTDYTLLAARGALVDVGLSRFDRTAVACTVRIPATRALRLR